MPTSDDVTIENLREPHVGNRASPYTASNAHAVRVGGVPTDSNGTNNDGDYSRAWRPSSSPSASTASRTFDYKPTTHTRFETSSPTSDGAQFTFLEQLRRDAAGRGGGGTIGDATRYEPKTTFNHGYANHWDAPESGSPVRDVVTSIGAIGTLAAGNVAAPADVAALVAAEGRPFVILGGEALLAPGATALDALEARFALAGGPAARRRARRAALAAAGGDTATPLLEEDG